MKTTVTYESSTPDSFEVSESVATSALNRVYHSMLAGQGLDWTTRYDTVKVVGHGGQGTVFLSERAGADGFKLPVAVKVFSPAVYGSVDDYHADMQKIARIAALVAEIQHDHLLDVNNFVEQDGIRVMVMEWINGFDVRQLLGTEMLEQVCRRIAPQQWQRLNDVIITAGPEQARLKPGIAIQVFRECVMGLAALHRSGVVHGDIKPSNIMLKRTGNAKIIDIGSAVDIAHPGRRRAWTPAYAAVEVLEGAPNSVQSDLASLGYVLVEMLAGRPLFAGLDTLPALLEAKKTFRKRLRSILPPDITRNNELMGLCKRLVDADPRQRMQSAEEANFEGAAVVHRQLVQYGLDSDYENDIRVWIESLPPHAWEQESQ